MGVLCRWCQQHWHIVYSVSPLQSPPLNSWSCGWSKPEKELRCLCNCPQVPPILLLELLLVSTRLLKENIGNNVHCVLKSVIRSIRLKRWPTKNIFFSSVAQKKIEVFKINFLDLLFSSSRRLNLISEALMASRKPPPGFPLAASPDNSARRVAITPEHYSPQSSSTSSPDASSRARSTANASPSSKPGIIYLLPAHSFRSSMLLPTWKHDSAAALKYSFPWLGLCI